jgi:hypothetical protein
VGALEHVDRVHLHAADVFDEPTQARRGERARPRQRQMLPFEEERGDGVQRNGLQRARSSARRAASPLDDLRGVLAVMRHAGAVDETLGGLPGREVLLGEPGHRAQELAMRNIGLVQDVTGASRRCAP